MTSRPLRHSRLLLACFAAIACAHAIATAQCAPWPQQVFPGLSSPTYAVARLANGNVVFGGDFNNLANGSMSASRVIRWDGSQWHPMGAGLNGRVVALLLLPDGTLLAGGAFTMSGSAAVPYLAGWNGTSWAALDPSLNGAVSDLRLLPGGDVLVTGSFTIAGGAPAANIVRWNGSQWFPIGNGIGLVGGGGVIPWMETATILPAGDLVAAGNFLSIGGVPANRIARWDGSQWHAMGSGMDGRVFDLAVMANGDLIAAGSFVTAGGQTVNRIARWRGGQWQAMGSGMNQHVKSLLPLSGVELLAGGTFDTAGGQPTRQIARWDGEQWQTIVPNWFTMGIEAMALQSDGLVFLAGAALSFNNSARLNIPCPATVTPLAAGCAGSSGEPQLHPAGLPRLGATFRTEATALPATALLAAVSSFAQIAAVPLSPALPSPPGCHLVVAPDDVQLLLPTIGTAEWQLVIPNQTALAGMTFYQQMVPIELDPVGGIAEVTVTRAIECRIGSL
jgi:hypothetical protein